MARGHYDLTMRRWASRFWEAFWDTRSWRDRDRTATVTAWAFFLAAALTIPWVWPSGTVAEITYWTGLFVFFGLCVWYGGKRTRRSAIRPD